MSKLITMQIFELCVKSSVKLLHKQIKQTMKNFFLTSYFSTRTFVKLTPNLAQVQLGKFVYKTNLLILLTNTCFVNVYLFSRLEKFQVKNSQVYGSTNLQAGMHPLYYIVKNTSDCRRKHVTNIMQMYYMRYTGS